MRKQIMKPSKIKENINKYLCTISFTTHKNLAKVFNERKFLRIITLNNMIEGHNNIFIIRDGDDIEADISELQLDCAIESKARETNLTLIEKIKQLEAENKRLNSLVNKIQKLVTE